MTESGPGRNIPIATLPNLRDLAAWASAKSLYFRESSFALPEATQLLRHGFMKEVSGIVRGDLPGDLKDSWLAHVSYVYTGMNDLKRSPFTLVLIQAPDSLGFAQRVLLHDHDLSKLDMSNPDSDRQVIEAPDRSVRLESERFLERYALFTDNNQDENSVWRLFAPTLIDWLTHQAPKDFSFELQDGALCCFVPGKLDDAAALDELCLASARVFREVARIGAGSAGTVAIDPESRQGKIEARLAEETFDRPPQSVKKAAKAFKKGPFINDEAWKLGAEAFFREQAGAAGFSPITVSAYRASHIETFLPGEIARAAAGAPNGPWQDTFLVLTDNAEYDTMGWTILVADGRSPMLGRGILPTGVSSDRGLVKMNSDGRSLIFTTLDGGIRDRKEEELGAFLKACGSVLGSGARRRPVRLSAGVALDQFDPVVVGVTDEAEPGAALTHRVRRSFRRDSVGREPLQGAVHVTDRDRDVTVTGTDLIRPLLTEVPGQLEPRTVVLEPHEDVDCLLADRNPPQLLHAELLVERDRPINVEDAVTGVDQFGHCSNCIPISPIFGIARLDQ